MQFGTKFGSFLTLYSIFHAYSHSFRSNLGKLIGFYALMRTYSCYFSTKDALLDKFVLKVHLRTLFSFHITIISKFAQLCAKKAEKGLSE